MYPLKRIWIWIYRIASNIVSSHLIVLLTFNWNSDFKNLGLYSSLFNKPAIFLTHICPYGC